MVDEPCHLGRSELDTGMVVAVSVIVVQMVLIEVILAFGADRFDGSPGLGEVPDESVLVVQGHDMVALFGETEPFGVVVPQGRI
jgi:hypothetical protein